MKTRKIFTFGCTLFLAAILFGASYLSMPYLALAAVPSKTLHYYKNPKVQLQQIRVDLVYFIPKDFSGSAIKKWQAPLQEAGEKLEKFYEMQFDNATDIKIQIYSKPIIGKQNTDFYNGPSTDSGNPQALLTIEGELKKRLYSPRGDLWKKDFEEPSGSGVFRVLGIIYEGVGASGSGQKRTFLIAREFLTREMIKNTHGLTFFAHEFGHTLGMPDLSHGADSETGIETVFSNDDIMGAGRFKPLSRTYLSDEIQKHMIYDPTGSR